MNTCISKVVGWLDRHLKAKQWAWFVALWLAGLFTVLAISYPIKLLIKSMG